MSEYKLKGATGYLVSFGDERYLCIDINGDWTLVDNIMQASYFSYAAAEDMIKKLENENENLTNGELWHITYNFKAFLKKA